MIAIHSSELTTRPDAHLLSNGLQFNNGDVATKLSPKQNAFLANTEFLADLYNMAKDKGLTAAGAGAIFNGTPSKGTVSLA